MRARSLILLLLAVLLAGGTALLARSWLAAERSKELKETAPLALQTPARSVLVARAEIRRGQILRPEDAIWQVWPEGGVDKSYVMLGGPKTPESYAGWVSRNPIAGGEPITESKIIKPGDRGFLAAVLRPGMRAISVPVTITSGISGFIFPGDQVDLMLTYAVPSKEKQTEATKSQADTYEHKVAQTVLRDIRVIAIDQRVEAKAGEAVPAHTATFEVTPKQSEAIILASEIGKLSLTLRSLVPDPTEGPSSEPAISNSNNSQQRSEMTPASAMMTAAAAPVALSTVADQSTGSSMPVPDRVVPAADTAIRQYAQLQPSPAPAPPPTPSTAPRSKIVSPGAAPGSIGANSTYTLDSEISTLLPQPKTEKDSSEPPKFWICKGGGPDFACTSQTGSSDGDRFLAAFRELKSQGAVFGGFGR